MELGVFEVSCILFVFCTVVISILAFIYSSDSRAPKVKLESNRQYNERLYTSRKKGELRNDKRRASVQNNRRMRENAEKGKDGRGSVINLRENKQNEHGED